MDYSGTKDNDLWIVCRDGDQSAFDVLFERYYHTMLRTVSHRVVDAMAAEELVMDAFLNLWIKRERIDIEGDFLSYLFKCVFNNVLGHLRKEVRIAVDPKHSLALSSLNAIFVAK